MHSLFRSYVAQQVFVERPRPAFGTTATGADLDEVREVLRARGHEIAALVIEPIVQGPGGMWLYDPSYLKELVDLCREYDVLVLLDEIATGFGRTGTLFAMEHAGVVPDILCLGKALTGGYLTLGATLCTDEVAAGICAAPGGALMHGPTFMANPLACAVAQASVRLLLDGPWQQRVRHIEQSLREQLDPCRQLPGVADVRVHGAIGVVELAEPVDLAVVQPALVDRGAWVRPFGRLVYTMPPYVSSDADLRAVTGAIVGTLSDLAG